MNSEGMSGVETLHKQPPVGLPVSKGPSSAPAPSPKEIRAITEAFRAKARFTALSNEFLVGSTNTLDTSSQPAATEAVEEYFDGIVEEIADDGIRLSTVSSGGEEAEAWLPWTAFEEDPGEKVFAQIGAPIRITVFSNRTLVRVLRPSQWRTPPEASSAVADMLMTQMQKILERG